MATAAILPEISKRIVYNRDSKNYDCYISIDGDPEQYIGSAETYGEGETKCRDYAFHYYEDNNTPEKALQVALTDGQADQDTPFGTIHGYPVFATRYDEPGEDYHGQLYKWSLDWNGKTISIYDDADVVSFWPAGPTSCMDEIHLDDWRWVRALAQTDLVERLVALARGQAEPPPAEPAIRIVLQKTQELTIMTT